MYSPVPTPFHCPTCDVYCTSGQLLEAHLRGRKHQRRAAGLDSPTKAGLQPGRCGRGPHKERAQVGAGWGPPA